jgi:hypothetical protein
MPTIIGPLANQLDQIGAITYIGEATPGTALSSALWRIKKVAETGPDVTITWADGNSDFDNIWDDRLILSYS